MTDIRTFDPDIEWMDHVRPVGLVVAPNVLKRMEAIPERQTQADTAAVAALQREGEGGVLSDTWGFFTQVLGWEPRFVAGAPGGPAMPQELARHYPEYDTTLTPDWAVAEPDAPGTWQLLVRLEAPGVEPDRRAALEGWEATPQQRFERLLRDTGVFAGVLVTDHELRLVYAPRGETSGWLAFPLRELSTVSGRVMLGGLKVVLGRARLFTEQTARRLPALLKQSREAQAEVSTKLAGQVLGALYELLRGLTVADGPRIAALAKDRPDHLYEGLLTVLMRLVFALYAEDRDLIPSHTDPKARDFYAANYGVRGLYGQLAEDDALHPDTMDERYGAWGRLLALFRLIYGGEKSGFVQARRGKLFDPDAFPFLEGRTSVEDAPRVLKVSDGCIFRILDGLTTIDGENARERLSYRSLDVEQIGSVYETIMGFEAALTTGPSIAIKAGKNNRTPVFVELEALFKKTGKNRIKELKETTGRTLSAGQSSAVEAAASVEDLKTALESIVDERASPKKRVSPAGTPILQPTDERRRTGSHYTPRSLTAPIVKHALEPAFERIGPDATPEQVLDLKVCDPAMGSGAFLVEAGRALGERLVAAWARWPDKRPVIPADEDEDLHARRIVAQRCLYGVDKNERAVDLARLSLWLATLARDHEFTFLDHALKCGDSLVGLSKDQIAATHWDETKPPTFVGKLVSDHLREAEAGRARIREADDSATEAELRPQLRAVDAKLEVARRIGDGIIAAFFGAEKPKKRIEMLVEFQKSVQSSLGSDRWAQATEGAVRALREGKHAIAPFHWQIEFPEVFARKNGGFDAVVGNPPFLGGTLISGHFSKNYLLYLKSAFPQFGDRADLVAVFFRRAFGLTRANGSVGLIATNSISQGDTRKSGLAWILPRGGQITSAVQKMFWPGDAAVVVSVVHLGKGTNLRPMLNNQFVSRVSAYLVEGDLDEDPYRLVANYDKCFEGFVPYGAGFLFCPDTVGAHPITLLNELTREGRIGDGVIWPFIGGEELNDDPRQLHKRYVIYFGKDNLSEARARSSALVDLLERTVRPERGRKSERVANAPWWQFLWPRPRLFEKLRNGGPRFLALSKVSKHHALGWLDARTMPSNRLAVFVMSSAQSMALLQSRVHELWARKFGSTLEDRPVYTSRDCFETFAFPVGLESNRSLEAIGENFVAFRAGLMVDRNEGLTKTYNRFHARGENTTDIVRLRALHHEMDVAVLRAYGWDDLADRAAPEFIEQEADEGKTPKTRLDWPSDFKDEVLARLLALNATRAAEERAAGLVATDEANDEEDSGETDD